MSSKNSDPIFDPALRSIESLMGRVSDGTLAIPNFQRDFTWEPRRTKDLIRSIMSRFPAGTLLFWTTGGGKATLDWREVEGAPKAPKGSNPQELVLDGQQRLTCLYQSLYGVGEERFYVRLNAFWTGNIQGVKDPSDIAFEDAIFWKDIDAKDFAWHESSEAQYKENFFPLVRLDEFEEWLDDYIAARPDLPDPISAKKVLRRIKNTYLKQLEDYQFPVIYLPSSTSLEALCNVFETLNTTSKPLGVFELLTARFYPHGKNIREMWDDAKENSPLLVEFRVDPYAIMQAMTLRAHRSAQRSAVMERLTSKDLDEHWNAVVRGFDRVLDTLRSDCGVLAPAMLPYNMLLVPMAACWEEVQALKGPKRSNALAKLKRYFWCTAFTANFDQGANSQATADYARLQEWLTDDSAEPPEAIDALSVTQSSLLGATTRRKALFAAVQALTVTSKARDFYSGETLTSERLKKDRIESHHVFPKAFLAEGETSRSSELVLNRALIDPITNKTISKNRPSVYVKKIAEASSESLADIFDSHLIDADEPDDALLQDDYLGFLRARLERVGDQIEVVTGNPVVEDVDWDAWTAGKRSFIV